MQNATATRKKLYPKAALIPAKKDPYFIAPPHLRTKHKHVPPTIEIEACELGGQEEGRKIEQLQPHAQIHLTHVHFLQPTNEESEHK